MNENTNKTIQTKDEYVHSMHVYGRLIAIISIVIMLAMPIIAGLYFNALPSLANVLTTGAGLLAIFIPTNIGEVISFTPIVGSSVYLSFITGNVTNLKLPVATSAMQMMDVPYGSEEADIFSSVAIGISSFVTIAVIAIGVVLMIPLQPVLALEPVKQATSYILPALFGTLIVSLANPNLGGGLTCPGRLKGAVIPFLLVAVVAALDKFVFKIGIMSKFQGIVIIALLPMLYFGTKAMYKKGQIKVCSKDDPPK